MAHRVALSGILLFALLAAPAARADAPASDAAGAQALFDEGRAAIKRNDHAAACPKFVQSHRLQPAGGTILHAADCHERTGKLATAYAEYSEALSFAVRDGRKDRERIARDRLAALGPRLGKLELVLAPDTKDLPGLEVALDGVRLSPELWSASFPVDAGEHTIEVRAPGHESRKLQATAADGEVRAVTVEALVPVAALPSAEPSAPLPSTSSHPQRTIGIAVAAAGAAALLAGSVFGVVAMTKGDQSDRCTLGPEGRGCPREAVDDQDSARTFGTLSTVAFVAGGVLGAAGVALYFTAPRDASATVGVAATPGGARVALEGRF